MDVLHSAVSIMTPLLFAATGGLFTELAGLLNIALEGMILAGAFAAIIGAHVTGSLWAGTFAGILAGLVLAGLLGFFTLRLRSNVFITGLAANLFASGLTVVLSHRFFGTRGVLALGNIPRLPALHIPGLPRLPVLSNHSGYVYVSWLLLVLAWVALYRTPFGFRLRACSRGADALVSLGLKPDSYRFCGFLLSGCACGIGGAYLALNLGVFVPNMSSGKGWIALVVIFLGGRHPAGLFVAAFMFGLAEAFSNYAQGSFNIPADFILAIPYIFTLFVMAGFSIFSSSFSTRKIFSSFPFSSFFPFFSKIFSKLKTKFFSLFSFLR
ncbi:MAG: ABC transporter permease [Spirochaetaceae bacterium]|jgi:simple sugar transport system permease protein|nr:ABC transporter permease [Spirochaetaceae bacterium]